MFFGKKYKIMTILSQATKEKDSIGIIIITIIMMIGKLGRQNVT